MPEENIPRYDYGPVLPNTESDPGASREAEGVDLVNLKAAFVDRLPNLATLQERIFRQAKTRLFQEFRWDIEASTGSHEIVSHDRYLAPRGAGYSLYGVLSLDPIKGFSLITIDGALIAALVDDLFGASEPAAGPVSADISVMENRIGQRLMGIVGDALDGTLQQYFPVAMEIVRTEAFAALASVADSSEQFCVMRADVSLRTGGGGISIAIPYRGLEPFIDVLASPIGGLPKGDEASLWAARMGEAVDSAPIEVTFEIGTITISAGDLGRLAPGMELPIKLHESAKVIAGDIILANASYGPIDNKYGVLFDK